MNECKLIQIQDYFSQNLVHFSPYMTISSCLSRQHSSSDDVAMKYIYENEYVINRVKKMYSISDSRYQMLNVINLSKNNNWDKLFQYYSSNKNSLPIEVYLLREGIMN